MNLYLEQLGADDWKVMSTNAHRAVYGLDVPNDSEKIDYAILIRNDDEPMGFATVSEIDSNTAYMTAGGAFPNVRGTMFSLRGYAMIMAWMKEHYQFVRTHIASSNVTMIKYALAVGLKISGTEFYDDQVYVNFAWER